MQFQAFFETCKDMENPRVLFILFIDFKEYAYTFHEYLTREDKETEND